MITHFLGREQVEGYCRDLVRRLIDLEDAMPKVWCPIGTSGQALFDIIIRQMPEERRAEILLQPLTYHKGSDESPSRISITPRQGMNEQQATSDLAKAVKKLPALVIDSSVHSGSSMLNAAAFLSELGAKNPLTYSLVIKQSSGFIPHYFGVVVGDHDRALFLLDQIPNNRLSKPTKTLKGYLRRLTENDVDRPGKLDTGVDSISKIGWGDLWYEMRAHGYEVYVVESEGALCGFVKYRLEPPKRLMLDVIAVDKSLHEMGVGSALFRWAETAARTSSCHSIALWGIEKHIPDYEKAGYKGTDEWINAGGGEKYQFMTKPLLYHFNLKDLKQ